MDTFFKANFHFDCIEISIQNAQTVRKYGLRCSFAQSPSSETPAPALTLFGCCIKMKLWKGMECLRFCSWNPGVKLVKKVGLTVNGGGVAARSFKPSKWDCWSVFWVVGHGSSLNTSSVLLRGRWTGKSPQTLWWTCHLTSYIRTSVLLGEQNILAICSKPESCISCIEETYQLFQLTRVYRERHWWLYNDLLSWREYVLVCDALEPLQLIGVLLRVCFSRVFLSFRNMYPFNQVSVLLSIIWADTWYLPSHMHWT